MNDDFDNSKDDKAILGKLEGKMSSTWRTSVGDLRGQDIIDSRDVIARIEELEGQQEGEELECHCEDETPEGFKSELKPDMAECGTCGFQWCDRCNPTPSARCHNEYNHLDEDEAEELKDLKELAEEAEGYAPDWHHGEALIADSYFETYAQQMAEDIGAIKGTEGWPLNCIDWERAARELQYDYTQVSFGGVDYWIRS